MSNIVRTSLRDSRRSKRSEGQTARSRIKRLVDDHLAEKTGERKDGNVYKATFRKTGVLML